MASLDFPRPGTRVKLLWGLTVALSMAIALTSYRHALGVGSVPPFVATNPLVVPWLAIHAGGAATALAIGSFQFLGAIRRRWPAVHRWNGRVYVTACLVGGISGFVLALGASMGAVTTAGFASLAVIWLAATGRAWQMARQRRFVQHREWMIRSWSLTFAAVTLRIYLPVSGAVGIPLEVAYPAIAFLCWVPNLIAAELYLRATAGGRIAPA